MTFLKRLFSNRPIHADLGLLVLRLGAGLTLALVHGWGKITGGPELWVKLGGSMDNLGITFALTMWGFFAAAAEFFGALFVVLGVAFRPAAAIVAFNMLVAALHHLNLPADSSAAGWKGASHALELMAAYLGLLFTGPGRYTLVGLFKRPGGAAGS